MCSPESQRGSRLLAASDCGALQSSRCDGTRAGVMRGASDSAGVHQYFADRRSISDNCDKNHLASALRTQQRENLVDPRDQRRPHVARR